MSDLARTDSESTEGGVGPGGPVLPPREQWGAPLSKTVDWYDPAIALRARADLTGLQYIEAVMDGRLPSQPFASLVGFRVTAAGEGSVTVTLTPDPSLLNTNGLVHGGVLCTMMDAAMGLSSLTTLPAGEATVTVELKVSFLKPIAADGQDVSAVGHILRSGRRISYAEAHAYDSAGALVGHASATFAAVAVNPPK